MNGIKNRSRIIIIGGGLSGLVSSILLIRYGFEVTVIEKKVYPFHRVCGEYVSNEVVPFLNSIEININHLEPSRITRLAVSAVSGKIFTGTLDLGGFGISRYTFDSFIYQKALAEGVNFILGQKATSVSFSENRFEVVLENGSVPDADLVIASYGKRSNLDKELQRSFFYRRSPYIGVKYHIQTDFPADVIQLDIFKGGYCGIVKIEEARYCLCYLSERSNLKRFGRIEELERNILYKNPNLKRHFTESQFLYDKPEVINEISFERKPLVQNHILFTGDAAGMITPLCGNGMAMAIHSAKLIADTINQYPGFKNPDERQKLEQYYKIHWEKLFARRLKVGRVLQKMLRYPALSDTVVGSFQLIPHLPKFIIPLTHGKPF